MILFILIFNKWVLSQCNCQGRHFLIFLFTCLDNEMISCLNISKNKSVCSPDCECQNVGSKITTSVGGKCDKCTVGNDGFPNCHCPGI